MGGLSAYTYKLITKLDRIENDLTSNKDLFELLKNFIDGNTASKLISPIRMMDNELYNDLSSDVYYADNREVFFTIDARDCLNYAIGIHSILDNVVNDLYKLWLDNERKKVEKNIIAEEETETLNLNDYLDSNGYNINELLKMANKKIDSLLSSLEEMEEE